MIKSKRYWYQKNTEKLKGTLGLSKEQLTLKKPTINARLSMLSAKDKQKPYYKQLWELINEQV